MRSYRQMKSVPRPFQSGFTLVEMIMVMVITGILGGMVALFIRGPVQGYVDSARRADMTGIADTALWRITRDLRLALPNSVRVRGALSGSGSCNGTENCYLEFIPITGGARYRSDPAGTGSCGGAGDALSIGAADTCFEVIGPMPVFAAGDSVVVDNLGAAGQSAYEVPATNRASWSSNTATHVIIASMTFPSPSPGNSFQAISTPVSYVCDLGSGTLKRYWGYPIQAAQPANMAAAPLATASSALLATHVGACDFVLARPGLATMQLTLTASGESISLYGAAHVSNVP